MRIFVRLGRWLLALGVVIAGCTTTEGNPSTTTTHAGSSTTAVLTTTPSDEHKCFDPPLSEVAAPSKLVLTVDPNPVAAGTEAILSVASNGLPSDVVIGAGAAWQCWNGSSWVDTHHIMRGTSGGYRTQAVVPGATTTVPAVGLIIPNSYSILIPEVDPGVYRIVDVAVSATTRIVGFVIVEVP